MLDRKTIMFYVEAVKKFMRSYEEELQDSSFFISFNPYLEYGYHDPQIGWVTRTSDERFSKEDANIFLDKVIEETALQESDGMIRQIRGELMQWS